MRKLFLLFALITILNITAFSQWQHLKNMTEGRIATILIDNDRMYVLNYDEGLFLSTDNGETWKPKNNGLKVGGNYINGKLMKLQNGELLLFGANTGIFKSTDNSDSWVQKISGLDTTENFNYSYYVIIDNKIFISTAKGVICSTDNGESWTFKNDKNNYMKDGVMALATYKDKIYTEGWNGNLFISSDDGNNWNYINNNINSTFYMLVNKDIIFLANIRNGLYKSMDEGKSWVNKDFNNQGVFCLASYGNYLFASVDNLIVLSTDNGETWQEKNKWKFESTNNKIKIIGDEIFIGTQGTGVYYAKISDLIETGVEDNSNSKNSDFIISPNPATDNITITLSENLNDKTSISIFNYLGEEVERFDNQVTNGQNSINISSESFPTGIYQCVLTIGKERVTKRFVVAR